MTVMAAYRTCHMLFTHQAVLDSTATTTSGMYERQDALSFRLLAAQPSSCAPRPLFVHSFAVARAMLASAALEAGLRHNRREAKCVVSAQHSALSCCSSTCGCSPLSAFGRGSTERWLAPALAVIVECC